MIKLQHWEGLQHLRSCMVYTSLPWFCRAAHTHCVLCELKAKPAGHMDIPPHRCGVFKEDEDLWRVFIRSEADTFATLAFQASEWAEGFESHY